MSYCTNVKYTCGLCGNTFHSNTYISYTAFGTPDLDLRPPEMQRSTMPLWAKECPACGLVSRGNIRDEENKKHKDYIESEEYKTCQNQEISSSLARKFYKCALIELQENNKRDAYESFLCGAWACDDLFDVDGAKICRKKAIELFEDTDMKEDTELVLRQVDLLRRVGEFKKALTLLKTIKFKDITLWKIGLFQRNLCRKKDTSCYRVSDYRAKRR